LQIFKMIGAAFFARYVVVYFQMMLLKMLLASGALTCLFSV